MNDQALPTTPPADATANWYPDPENANQLRYWDGAAWTSHVHPSAAQPAAAQPGPAPQQPIAAVAESAPGAINAPLATYQGPPMLVSTMNDLPGYEVEEVYGEVFGLVVRARNAFANIGASFRTVFGGEAKGYTTLLTNSRHEAQARLMAAAHERGANAILAMRFDCNEIADVMSEVAAYGTAVKVRKL